VKFTDLTIQNFLAISEAKVSLNQRGLCLIQGVNEDNTSAESNGAGKSSIADALCWVLYGQTARGESGDKIINRTAGKGTVVNIEVEDGADAYYITRHRKHKVGKNNLTLMKNDGTMGGWRDISKGTDKLTQEAVEQIIGCSYDVFRASIYAGQESLPDLPGMTDRNLKTLIEEAAGTSILEAAYEEARGRLRAATDTRNSKIFLRNSVMSNIDATEKERANASAELSRWSLDHKHRYAIALNQARTAATNAKAIDDEIRGKRAELESKITGVEAAIRAVSDELKEEKRLAELLATEDRCVASAATNLINKSGVVHSLMEESAKIADRVGQPCGECGRPYTPEELEPAIEILTEKIHIACDERKAAQEHMESTQKTRESVADELEKFRASMTDLSATNAQRASLSAELGDVIGRERDRDLLIKGAKSFKQRSEEIDAEANPYDVIVDRLDKRLALQKLELAEAEKLLEIAEKDVTKAALVSDVFAPAGVRAHILDHVTPFLNGQTAKYLAVLSDGDMTATWSTLTLTAKGEYREKFSIDVTSKTGGESFGLISGGEKRKVRIATALALQDLVAGRAVKPIDLFIGDEIDDALDEAGLERLMMILEEKARERGTVLLISHNSLRDWVSNIITVTKKDGKSTIEEYAE
jgi:DNA repair exonuclease SbcCD ATPase subunit